MSGEREESGGAGGGREGAQNWPLKKGLKGVLDNFTWELVHQRQKLERP